MCAAVRFQAHAHDAIEHEREEANERMCATTVGQSMEYRRNFQIALEHTKAAFDVGQALVALHDVFGSEVGDIGQKY